MTVGESRHLPSFHSSGSVCPITNSRILSASSIFLGSGFIRKRTFSHFNACSRSSPNSSSNLESATFFSSASYLDIQCATEPFRLCLLISSTVARNAGVSVWADIEFTTKLACFLYLFSVCSAP